jgi:tRNA pseudouridine55 synthase
LARKNKDIELKPKLLVIDNVELLTCELPIITIKVVCSKGTYIRALARDIGRELGSGAHLTQLVRTRVGEATLDECLQVSELDRFFDENIKNDPDFLIK